MEGQVMKNPQIQVHPYLPNSVPEITTEMLKEIGVKSIDELYADIPGHLRFKGEMDLPKPLTDEFSLKRHVASIMAKNKSTADCISFLGGGCWPHHVPAICDEVNSRSEFLTAYAGEPYEDHGRFQALFEYESMMGELLDMDVVNVPTFDWSQALSTSIRMAERMTDRHTVLVAETMSPSRLAVVKNYCRQVMEVNTIKFNADTGFMDLDDLKSKLTDDVAAVYFENPSYLGFIEDQGQTISDMTHENGSICIVGVDPISLGVLTPPAQYGADIVCGDIQPLGMHQLFGGGQAGFISTRDEERFVMEFPSRLFGITRTAVEGEWGFGDVAYERTSFAVREEGKEFIGTATALWGITAGVYLALMGPNGMKEIGQTILQKSQYAAKKIDEIKGIKAPKFNSTGFKEFVVDFSGTGKSVEKINKALLEKGIFGGKDLSVDFPGLANCALYCVTEVHTQEDIDNLVTAIGEIAG
jgi:glycine dehydrogenase subunit 1